MKAEINNKNKAKFFVLYWKQDVFTDGQYIGWKCFKKTWIEGLSAILKPLSSISDEDALEFAKWSGVSEDEARKNMKQAKPLFIKAIIDEDLPYHACDLLRSRGYALPWMGLSVEEMVEAGWVRLTT